MAALASCLAIARISVPKTFLLLLEKVTSLEVLVWSVTKPATCAEYYLKPQTERNDLLN